jgi:predicted Zn-dependent protease
LAIGLALSVISADAGGRAAAVLLNQTSGLMMRGYGRDHEREADAGAMRAAAALHGHVGGVIGLFDRIAQARSCGAGRQGEGDDESTLKEVPTWLGTHPADVDRSEAARQWAHERGIPLSGASLALTPALQAWAAKGKDRCEGPRQP